MILEDLQAIVMIGVVEGTGARGKDGAVEAMGEVRLEKSGVMLERGVDKTK